MAEKIAVITTGGTIGSVISGASVSVDPTGIIVREEIAKICKRRELDVTVDAALNKHSEDLTPADWSAVAQAISQKLAEGVTRIVITHGTDTLAYTAAACGLLFGMCNARICLTGSFHSLEAQDSDGPLNLIAAFRSVASDELPTGVYVAFRANDRNTQASIIPALLLKPMLFDGLAFEGSYATRAAVYGPKQGFNVQNIELPLSLPNLPQKVPNPAELSVAAARVLQLFAYPGLNFDAINTSNLSAIIVGLYHSGTAHSADVETSLVSFIRKQTAERPVYLATFPSRYIQKPYDSTVKLAQAGGHIIKDLQPHVIFAMLAIGGAQGHSADELHKLLSTWTLRF